MNLKMLKAGLLSVALCAAAAPSAFAQMTWTDKAFVNISLGGQASNHTLDTSTPFDLYDEAGTVSSSQKIGGGGLFDINGGYKVMRNLVAGVGYSITGDRADAAVTAQVPDPAFTDRPRTVSASAPNLKHSENVINFFAAYMIPVTDKIDVGISAGPSLFMVSQEIPSGVTIKEPTPTVKEVTVAKNDKTSVGVNFGIDVAYMMTDRLGVGGLMRYTFGSADFDNASDKLSVGGFQIGVGLRLRLQ